MPAEDRKQRAEATICWCAQQEGLALDQVELRDLFDQNAYRAIFWREGRICRHLVPYAWVDDCDPQAGLVDGRMRQLLTLVQRKLG